MSQRSRFENVVKILFRGTRMMLRRGPTLDYFDGEIPVHDASAPPQ